MWFVVPPAAVWTNGLTAQWDIFFLNWGFGTMVWHLSPHSTGYQPRKPSAPFTTLSIWKEHHAAESGPLGGEISQQQAHCQNNHMASTYLFSIKQHYVEIVILCNLAPFTVSRQFTCLIYLK